MFTEHDLAYLSVLIQGRVPLSALLAPQRPLRFRGQPVQRIKARWKLPVQAVPASSVFVEECRVQEFFFAS